MRLRKLLAEGTLDLSKLLQKLRDRAEKDSDKQNPPLSLNWAGSESGRHFSKG